MRIERVDTELYAIPLSKPMMDASHGVQSDFSLIVVKITTDDGATGMGYTYSVGQVGGTSIATLIRDSLSPILIGEDPRRIEHLWNKMWWALHYVGRGGIAVFGLSAVDTALWDLKSRLAGEPLWRFLGGHDKKVEAYGGGIDFAMTIEQLEEQAQRFLDAGLHAIKIKVGRDSIAEECDRIAAMRKFLGPDKKLMVDVNMKWSVEKALRAARAFEKYDLYWMEEPTIPDDVEGHRRIETEGAHSRGCRRELALDLRVPSDDRRGRHLVSGRGHVESWWNYRAHESRAYRRSVQPECHNARHSGNAR